MLQVEFENSSVNPWAKIFLIFYDPVWVMESLASGWAWFPAWAVAVVITLLGQIPAILKYTEYVDDLIASGQVPAQIANMQRWATIAQNAVNPVVSLLGQALICGALMAFINAFHENSAQRFGRWFSVAMWAALPTAVGASLFKAGVQMLYTGPAKLMFAGPAMLLADQSHGLLKTFLVTLDLFSVLFISLCAVGVYALNGRKLFPSTVTAAAIFAGYFLINLASWH